MKAMLLTRPGATLECVELPSPRPGPGEIRLKVLACAVCRTDLHVIDGELPTPSCRSYSATKSSDAYSKWAKA